MVGITRLEMQDELEKLRAAFRDDLRQTLNSMNFQPGKQLVKAPSREGFESVGSGDEEQPSETGSMKKMFGKIRSWVPKKKNARGASDLGPRTYVEVETMSQDLSEWPASPKVPNNADLTPEPTRKLRPSLTRSRSAQWDEDSPQEEAGIMWGGSPGCEDGPLLNNDDRDEMRGKRVPRPSLQALPSFSERDAGVMPDESAGGFCEAYSDFMNSFVVPIAKSAAFEVLAGAAVVLNCIQIGIESDSTAQGRADQDRESRNRAEFAFCVWFSLELILRLLSAGCLEYFCGDHRSWNWFDCFMVFFQILQVGSESSAFGDAASASSVTHNVGVLRLAKILRLLRLVRIARLLRIVRFLQDMKTITVAMLNAFSALTWTMVLMFMILYIWSVIIIEVISNTDQADYMDNKEEVDYYFGSLGRAMLTMFECIVGGISWDLVVTPLIRTCGPAMGTFFVVYIIILVYALTNMMTGMFVQKAMQFAIEHSEQYSADCIRDLWFKADSKGDTQDIDFARFEEMLGDSAMNDYFRALNVDTSEAKILFDLLDEDGSGDLEPAEIVSGCMRLRGPAKALNLALLMRRVSALVEMLEGEAAVE